MSKLSAGFSKTEYPRGADRLMSVWGGTTQMSVPQDNDFYYTEETQKAQATPVKKQRPEQPPEQLQPTEQPRQSTLQTQGLCPGLLNSVLKH